MGKCFFICVLLTVPFVVKCQTEEKKTIPVGQFHNQNDSLVWQTANAFCSLFNKSDSEGLKRFLPDDFLLQWMHENFIGKKNLINTMRDSAIHRTMEYKIAHDNSAILKYADDQTSSSISTTFEFLDPEQMKSLVKQHLYGLCILYFKKENAKWELKTVHLDLHCSLCNF
jgi:hypothetical protein